jgi:hypothetical protein
VHYPIYIGYLLYEPNWFFTQQFYVGGIHIINITMMKVNQLKLGERILVPIQRILCPTTLPQSIYQVETIVTSERSMIPKVNCCISQSYVMLEHS